MRAAGVCSKLSWPRDTANSPGEARTGRDRGTETMTISL